MQQRDLGYFGPQSVTWKVMRESVLIVGIARAALMQLAHPLIAQAGHEHSSFLTNPTARAETTVRLGHMLVFGSKKTAQEAARTIHRAHRHVHGRLPVETEAFAAGTPYHAYDPELLLWVHATLADTYLKTYECFVAPLSLPEQEQFYQETKILGHLLGLNNAVLPATVHDVRAYIDRMLSGNHLTILPEARRYAQMLLFFPKTPWFLRPLHATITCALLPQTLREMYGLTYGRREQRLFALASFLSRCIIPSLPPVWRTPRIVRRFIHETLKNSLVSRVAMNTQKAPCSHP